MFVFWSSGIQKKQPVFTVYGPLCSIRPLNGTLFVLHLPLTDTFMSDQNTPFYVWPEYNFWKIRKTFSFFRNLLMNISKWALKGLYISIYNPPHRNTQYIIDKSELIILEIIISEHPKFFAHQIDTHKLIHKNWGNPKKLYVYYTTPNSK
jgi:hypothetical protein